MKKLLLLFVLALAALFLHAQIASAQEEMEMEMEEEAAPAEAPACKFICAPVFLFMPGVVATNVIDPPEVGGEEVDGNWDFMLRWQVVAPTAIPRLSLVAETQWTPFATADGEDDEEDEFELNAPIFVYGLIITLFDSPYFTAILDPIFLYTPDAPDPEAGAAFDHKFTLELGLIPKIGALFNAPEGSYLSGVAAFALLDYIITGLPSEGDPGVPDEEAEPDHWVMLFGLILPIAPAG
jgi:hypothetical protein